MDTYLSNSFVEVPFGKDAGLPLDPAKKNLSPLRGRSTLESLPILGHPPRLLSTMLHCLRVTIRDSRAWMTGSLALLGLSRSGRGGEEGLVVAVQGFEVDVFDG